MNSPSWSGGSDDDESGRRTGQLLAGKYRLLRLIGQGGMGEVYEAQHAVVGRRFAVKFLHPHLAQSSSALLRFRREAQAAGALENEHIAAVTDFDTAADGAPFLVMEYLVGESLGQLLAREGPLPLTRVVSALLQVCQGLEAAHRAGIVHRDLKPDNLFLVKRSDGSDLLKILDFGIAKLNRGEASTDITRSGATLGTPFYMAPEQARGEKNIGERVDIYTLGVIAYELLSGQKPHPGDSYNSILAHILSQPVKPLASLRPGLPSAFTALVERALSTAPEDRQASAAAFAKELSAFVGREVAPIHSQLDLRAELGGAATVPTPGAHTVSVARDEPMASPPSAPSEERRQVPAPARPRARGPLFLLAFAAVAVGAVWLRARHGADVEERAPVGLASTTNSLPSSRGLIAPPSPLTAAQSEHAHPASTPAASVLSPPVSVGRARSAGRPATSAPRKETAPSASNSVTAAGGQAPTVNKPRVHFDENNPY